MEQTLGRSLYLAHRAVHDELDRRLYEHGASVWNWVLLREAANAATDKAGGASQRELAELMGIEPPTLVRHLDKLAEEGLVERQPDPDDRRVVRVIVTRAGRKRLAQLHQVVHEVDAELRSVLSAREVHALQHGLTHVYEHFSEEVASDRS
jgi:MarR family transcriptional regulator, transcriptional regulator for hemolysin